MKTDYSSVTEMKNKIFLNNRIAIFLTNNVIGNNRSLGGVLRTTLWKKIVKVI